MKKVLILCAHMSAGYDFMEALDKSREVDDFEFQAQLPTGEELRRRKDVSHVCFYGIILNRDETIEFLLYLERMNYRVLNSKTPVFAE